MIASNTSYFEARAAKSASIWAEKNNIKLTNIGCITNNVFEANCEVSSGNDSIALICDTSNCIKKINSKVIENNMTCESK